VSDDQTLPQTQPRTPILDTGVQADVFDADLPTADLTNEIRAYPSAGPKTDLGTADAPPIEAIPVHPADAPADQPDAPADQSAAPARSVTVPGRYSDVKWWQLVLTLAGVWIVAAPIGPALFYWWTRSVDKTPVVFVVLAYVVVCIAGGVMLAMVPDRPLVSALAIAVMSAVFASGVAATPFYGAFFCDHTTGRCLVGVIPY
jgi:hypothetical protein